MMKKSKNYWGFDTRSIDKSVRPQDDFYHYANGSWLKSAKIPPEESRWGSFVTLRVDTEHQLKRLVESTKDKKVRDMYTSAMDMKTRNKQGLKPLLAVTAKIAAIEDRADLQKVIEYLHVIGVGAPWVEFVDQDSKDSSKYILTFWQAGLGMPERDYYLLDKPEQRRVRDAYVTHIKKLTKLAGASKKEQERIVRVVIHMETRLAKASMRRQDMRDPHKIYHKMSVAQLQKLAPSVRWAEFLKGIGVHKPQSLMVSQPGFIKEVSNMFKDELLEDWKVYLGWHALNGSAGLLSEPFVKENFDFYARTLSGTKKMKPLWRRALGATNSVLADEIGKLYVKAHFPPAAKRAMDTLVSDLFDVFGERVKKLEWMSPVTKKKAINKMRAMRRKIAYPTKWKSYAGLEIKKEDYFGNMLRSDIYEHRRQLKKLGKPIDREDWFTTPQTVNAYFSPNMNEIVFPAAILQWPFFDFRADDALNYAGIGSVIGHEITHGFDDEGSKFDGKGNLKNWWSKADRTRFEKRAALIENQAAAHEVEPGVHMNGKLTLGENIADLGGLVIAWDAYHKHLKKSGRKDIEGLSPEQRFFLCYAQMERELRRPEMAKLAALTDPHAEASFRINNPVSNFAPFAERYDLKKNDRLYRAAKNRAEIW